MLERSDVSAEALPAELLQSSQPVLLRGLVRHWPLVQAARRSDAAFCSYLRGFGAQTRVGLWRGAPGIGGRFFYNEAFDGFNFERVVGPFGQLLDELLAGSRYALYLGSTELDASFPGLRQHNPLDLHVRDPLVSLWLGNRIRVPAHFDVPDNIACVVAGRRRFTLFPPELVDALYIGPLDLTPAGQPVSLVDLAAPDLARFPRFAEAQRQAQVVTLEPGDALFIPSQWWHGVEGLDPVNALVNFWWRQTPAYMDTPLNTLMLALLTLRDLPPAQRQAWAKLFDHYIFDVDDQAAAHIPPAARGVLGPIDETRARQLRAVLLNRLNR
ncbi:cupin-like domain-containing protein [Roseateles saccharophilus]|uniref:Cupin-like protein n=1 Tax=Roseateles saccharophilus TaxID=304 RepID=A0A4R3UPT4_ROSSA|nr:cupin-like domain-containing protein [Roseateles saccharophilus]MDG0835512.1 cupin-like domain-containing protein [Roseateles saccharophilus]TCU92680.1 cupin-like protein [Roseateles saccharophilus]